MESIIEQQRSAFEEIERLQQASVDLYMQNVSTHKDHLLREQKVNEFVEQIQNRSQTILDIYKDTTGARKKELADMSGGNEFKEFYSRLDDIKYYHKQNPYLAAEPMEMEFLKYKEVKDSENGPNGKDEAADDAKPANEQAKLSFVTDQDYENLESMFSGEEMLGRYLDLNAQHVMYLNLKDMPKISYLDYLKQFGFFEKYNQNNKDAKYAEYLESLCKYLEGFFKRSDPLLDIQTPKNEALAQFEKDWAGGSAKGWDTTEQQQSFPSELFCKPCNKQFKTEPTYKNHLGGRKHKKAQDKFGSGSNDSEKQNTSQPLNKKESIARLEYVIRSYIQLLKKTIQKTHENVERKQALTDKERNQELEEEEIEIPESDEEDEEHIYNPLKLPLGWDGKPIPYWLYKLHGLGVEYPCEICGNYIYKGRKAFDRHFQEARHANNMRRLGIPNTRQFHDITIIEDALSLWKKIKNQPGASLSSDAASANQDTFEEFEDSEGNVFNRKTYEDLKRQGLI